MIGTFDTVEMLAAVNITPRPRTFLRDQLFGGRQTAFETQYIAADFKKGKRNMAPFVSRHVGGKLVEKGPFATQLYIPPMVAPRGIFTGDEAFGRAMGEVIGGASSPDERAAAHIAEMINDHDMLITRREEWMLGKMLTTGIILIVGEGVSDEIDLNFTQTDTLSGDACWGESASKILADIRRWKRTVVQSSGISPDVAILGANAAEAFLEDENIQKKLDNRNMTIGVINPQDLPNGASFLGYIDGVAFYGYDEWYIDDESGVETPMVPDDTLVLFPSASRNQAARMLYGAMYDVEDALTYAGARIPRSWTDKGKNTRFMELVCFPLPYMPDVDSWLVATVIE